MTYTPSERLQSQLPYRASGKRGVQWFKYGQTDYQEFKLLIKDIVEEQRPMTVRQVFYRCVVKDYVDKTESSYGFVQRNLSEMRWSQMLPFDWIIDTSRQIRGSQGTNWTGWQEYVDWEMKTLPNGYGIDLLADNKFSVQVWLEKEALAGIF